MKKRTSILMLAVIVAAAAGPAHADDSWSLSKLNPFQKKPTADTRARASVSDETPSYEHLAQPRPTWKPRPQTPVRPKEPSTMDKISQSTKDLFGKTKDVLMPWSSDSKKKKKSSSASRSKSSEKSSFFTSWWPKKEEPQRAKTMPGWLGQDRPN